MRAFLDATAWWNGTVAVLFWIAAFIVPNHQRGLVEVDAQPLLVDGRPCLHWALPGGTPVLRELSGEEGFAWPGGWLHVGKG